MIFNTENFERFRDDLKEVVNYLEDKYEVKINPGSLTYDEYQFSLKLDVKRADGIDADEEIFRKYAPMYGLDPNDYRKRFTTSDGKTFQIDGIRTSARKNIVRIHNVVDNRRFVAPVSYVKRFI